MNVMEHAPMAAQPKVLKHSLKKKGSSSSHSHQQHMVSTSGSSKWPAARLAEKPNGFVGKPAGGVALPGLASNNPPQPFKGRRPSSVVTSVDWREEERKRQAKQEQERLAAKQREQDRFKREEQKRLQQKQLAMQAQQHQQMQHQQMQMSRHAQGGPSPAAMSSSPASTSNSTAPQANRVRRPSSVVTSLDWRSGHGSSVAQQQHQHDEPSTRSTSFSTVSSVTNRTPSPAKMMSSGRSSPGKSSRADTPSTSQDDDDEERPLTSAEAVQMVLKNLKKGKAHLGEDAPLTPPPSPTKKKNNHHHHANKMRPDEPRQPKLSNHVRTQHEETRQPPSPPPPQQHRQQQVKARSQVAPPSNARSPSPPVDLDDSSIGEETMAEDDAVASRPSSRTSGGGAKEKKERALSSDEAVQLVLQRMRSNSRDMTLTDGDMDDDVDEDDGDNDMVDSDHARAPNKILPPTGSSNAIWKTLQEAKDRQDAIRQKVRRYSSDDEDQGWAEGDEDAKHRQFHNTAFHAYQSPHNSNHQRIVPKINRLQDTHSNKVPYDDHHQLDSDPTLMFAEDRHMSDPRAWERLNQMSSDNIITTPPRRPIPQHAKMSESSMSSRSTFAASNVRTPQKTPSITSTSASTTPSTPRSAPRSPHATIDAMAHANDSMRSVETMFFDAEEDGYGTKSMSFVGEEEEEVEPAVEEKPRTAMRIEEPKENIKEEKQEEEDQRESGASSSAWAFSSMLGATAVSGASMLGQALSTSVSVASSTAVSASSMLSSALVSSKKGTENDDDDDDDDDDEDEDGYFLRRKPKHPPKNTAIASRELEIIRKCQEQMKVREIEEVEKRANAAKLDEENLRLQREEEAARAAVTREVQAYRSMMTDMGEDDKLAPEDKEKAMQEYDDRLAMADTLQEQEAKAKAAQEQMAKVDKQALQRKKEDNNESDGDSYSEYEVEGCCGCTVM